MNSSIPWKLDKSRKCEVANGFKEDYFNILEKHSIDTLFLTVSKTVIKELFDYNFYNYAANDCDAVEKKSIYGESVSKEILWK